MFNENNLIAAINSGRSNARVVPIHAHQNTDEMELNNAPVQLV